MENAITDRTVVEAKSLKAYFHDELNRVLDNQGTEIGDDTRAYLVNLLHHYSRSDRVFEWYEKRVSLRPLAMLYGEALQARNLHERRLMLRRLGDIALFIAGIFSPSLERKPVGVGYYIDMGGSAYEWLSDSLASTRDRSLPSTTFRELAENFEIMVNALDDFAGASGMRGDRELVSLYRKWSETHREEHADKLRRRGLDIDTGATRH
ncbi:MAG: hypothetical protein DWQ08_11370 [Proteobacteria bacterium]|nr:MAG: hypothetical protein DWQ08_11370 [Pseudomonadota bacterium]